MKTDNTDLKLATRSIWVFGVLMLVFVTAAVVWGVVTIHPGEVLPATTVDGPKTWAAYVAALLLGFAIGATGLGTLIFVYFRRAVLARQLRVVDGTVDGQ